MILQVHVLLVTNSEIAVNRAGRIGQERAFDDGFDRRHAAAAGNRKHWPAMLLAPVRVTERAGNRDLGPDSEVREHVTTGLAARNLSDVKLQSRLFRKARHRIAALGYAWTELQPCVLSRRKAVG